jgi:hypothetical protein
MRETGSGLSGDLPGCARDRAELAGIRRAPDRARAGPEARGPDGRRACACALVVGRVRLSD